MVFAIFSTPFVSYAEVFNKISKIYIEYLPVMLIN